MLRTVASTRDAMVDHRMLTIHVQLLVQPWRRWPMSNLRHTDVRILRGGLMRTTGTGSATRIHATFAVVAVLALSAAPAALGAQQALEPVKVHAGASSVSNPAADALAAEAKQHYGTP